METNVIIHCLKHAQLSDCLTCPYYVNLDVSVAGCRVRRLSEARIIVEKYQKIEQIMEMDWHFSNSVKLEEIYKVIKGHDSFLFNKEENHVDQT